MLVKVVFATPKRCITYLWVPLYWLYFCQTAPGVACFLHLAPGISPLESRVSPREPQWSEHTAVTAPVRPKRPRRHVMYYSTYKWLCIVHITESPTIPRKRGIFHLTTLTSLCSKWKLKIINNYYATEQQRNSNFIMQQ